MALDKHTGIGQHAKSCVTCAGHLKQNLAQLLDVEGVPRA